MNNKPKMAKHVILVALTVLTALLQHSFLPALGVRHTAWLLLALLTAIAMHTTELPAAAYGVLTGLLWDLTSPLPDGTFALLLAAHACACSLLARWLFRQTLLTAAVFCAAGCAVCFTATLLLYYLPKDASALPGVILNAFLPSLLLTAPALPVFYFSARAIDIRTGAKAGKTL